MKAPYIKFCGFTRPADAYAGVMLGADLIGLNFYAGSPRAVSYGLAIKIQEEVRRASKERAKKRVARTVAVLVNPDVEHVLGVLQHVKPDILQFHGEEPPHFCRYFRHPFIKAIRMRSTADATTIEQYVGGYGIGFLVDAYSDAEYGGTGKVLSFSLAQAAMRLPRGFLAGGLSAKNVREVTRMLKPYGLDVASGIETRPGVKSHELMAEFVTEVKAGVRDARP
ncbi:MAG: phosphoribosylanthranilate isomerase [Myxococcales bacterium]|nr:phosphoribosylanthranilate isomerase [Myxococcales bacterium]MCB9736315.1 phosphoribosylanthranilate isomerase [Deltaproteobacteria bacterium]